MTDKAGFSVSGTGNNVATLQQKLTYVELK